MDLLENIDPEQSRIDDATARLVELVTALPSNAERVVALNKIRMALHEVSPLRHEPVDCVQWVRAEQVQANDYNPNTVAPPEMELLQRSI
jgi:hypothetical protein